MRLILLPLFFLIGPWGSRRSTNTVLRETDKMNISVLPSRTHFTCDTRKSMFSHAHMPIGENLNWIDKNTQKEACFISYSSKSHLLPCFCVILINKMRSGSDWRFLSINTNHFGFLTCGNRVESQLVVGLCTLMETGFISLSLYSFIVSRKLGNEEMALNDGLLLVPTVFNFKYNR